MVRTTVRNKKRGSMRTHIKNKKKRSLQRWPFYIKGGGPDKCIFVPLGGGLGNQMYVYAAALTVMTKKKTLPMCLLPTRTDHSTTDYRLAIFKRGIPVEYSSIQERMDIAKNVLENIKNPHNTWVNGNIDTDDSRNIHLAGGFFQSYSSIKSVIPILRKDYKEVFEVRYPGFKDGIKPSSAFMHIRKGDYGGASLGADYYKRGLPILHDTKEITDIYILSDDIPWCKEQGFESDKIRWFDNPEESKDELKAMYLMSLCLGGACISASTFSSWGAILGADQNESSTIIYPVNWITGESSKIGFPSRWKPI